MKLLLVEDDPGARQAMAILIGAWGYEVLCADDGPAAWQVLQQADSPKLVVLDWMMPSMDGLEVCRRVRKARPLAPPYIILVTARSGEENLVEGLTGGADDYLPKPIRPFELRARLQVGQRILELQAALVHRIRELEAALTRVKQLQGLLPICMYCKKIRADEHYWQQVEQYISDHSDARFSHGICPECFERVLRTEMGESDIG